MVKIIYLSIYLSHVRLDDRLDYNNINTILLIFPKKKKKKKTFSPLKLYS